jgi:hypothetical protein
MEDERGRERSMGCLRNAYKNPGMETWKKERLIEWSRHGWEVNIRTDLNEIELKDVYRIYVAQDRNQPWNYMSMMILQVPLKV